MILDTLTSFLYDTDISASTGGPTTVGDQVDLFGLGLEEAAVGKQRDIGIHGHPIYYRVAVGTTAFDGASDSSAVTFALVTADSADLTSNPETVDTFTVSADAAAANYPAGAKLREIVLPSFDYKRYLGIRRTVATQNLSAGTVTAVLTLDPKGWKAYEQADVAD